ncbi:CPBP family intramembrane glutamic endopeptidase [Peribacillus deserti]|uniref:CAAX prenyl protease 2/Lysostaphin resistance protein A-like domain-containing protein n=1 Tax=Peribacillus deserti TaxID=673318 RepID=A0A2N5M6A4_9BACI|nr:CPBP family intramembrane glutamic endopeptidase [Peribacillus deserti]PLT29891.1 hypothetical protein CUU66_10135 [Peribacillus deserti]
MFWFTCIFIVAGIIFPIIDHFWDKKIKKDLANHNKMTTYSLVMLYQWGMVGIIFLTFKIKEISFKELGLVSTFSNISSFLYFAAGILTATVMLFVVYLAIPFGRKKIIKQFEAIELLIPVGIKQRLVYACVAVTAGFCEEVIYRGFMFHYFKQLDLGLSAMAMAIITSIFFGLAHGYQGWKNVIFTGILGFALARLYISNGSLWVPIILHIIIDIKFAVLPNIKKIFENKNKAAA